jgi:Immunity protein family (Imm11)
MSGKRQLALRQKGERKSMVKIWCQDPEIYTDAKASDLRTIMNIPVALGKELRELFPCELKVESKTAPIDFFKAGELFMVSEKVKQLIQAQQARVELFPVPVLHKKQVVGGFFFVNILDLIDCIDQKHTVRVGTGYFPNDIKRLVLHTDRVEGVSLFRIAGTILIGASDSLATAVEKAGCAGVKFASPRDWRNPTLLGD